MFWEIAKQIFLDISITREIISFQNYTAKTLT